MLRLLFKILHLFMNNTHQTFLVYGVSQGLGEAIIQIIPKTTDKIYGISRTEPQKMANLNWICADLACPSEAVEKVKNVIKNQKIDVFIYNVGVWENQAFTDAYNFESISSTEIEKIININMRSCIQSIQSLLDNLKQSNNAKIILIGSTWGVDHHNGKELIFSATKFALRGIVESLRTLLREHLIGVSLLNLGYLATEYKINTPTEQVLQQTDCGLIPLSDVIAAIQFIVSTSKASCVKEILMPAMKDENI